MIGERNIDSGKLPFRKEEGQQFPCEICLSAFLPSLTKKLLKMLVMTQELSIDLPLSNRVANQISNIRRKKSDEKTILSLRFVPSLQSVKSNPTLSDVTHWLLP